MDTNTPVGQVEFVAFDFETTGLQAASDGIVEFGAVRFRGAEISATFDRLSNPGVPISPEAGAVSGISDEDVANSPPVQSILPDFTEFLGEAVLMAHNAPFDLGFLRAAIQTSDLSQVENLVIDTQLLAIKAFPRRRSYSLQNLAADLSLPRSRAHRASDDAELCMRLFRACVDALSFMGDLPLSEVLTGPVGR